MTTRPDPLRKALLIIVGAWADDEACARAVFRSAFHHALGAARAAVLREMREYPPDFDDLAVEAALLALAAMPEPPASWADLRRLGTFSAAAARSAARKLKRRRGGRSTSAARRVDPLAYADRLPRELCTSASATAVPLALVTEALPDEDRLALVLDALPSLPATQRDAVRTFLARQADPSLPPMTAAQRQAWARARASLAAVATKT